MGSRERVCKPVRLAAVSMGCGIKGKGKEGRVSEGRGERNSFLSAAAAVGSRPLHLRSLPSPLGPPPLGLSIMCVTRRLSTSCTAVGREGGRVQQPQMRPRPRPPPSPPPSKARCIENQTTNQTVRHTRLQRARTRERAKRGAAATPIERRGESISPRQM